MLYRVGWTREVATLPSYFPERLRQEVFQGLVILDCEYGDDRDYLESGGYSLITETMEDVLELKKVIDYDTHLPEWVTRISDTGFLSALFIMNDDYSLMIYLPAGVAPETIKQEMEE